MKDIRAEILSNEKIGLRYFKMLLDAPFIARHAKPGQIVMVRCRDGLDPLLRRPFGVHRLISRKGIELLYEVVGKGTEILSKKKRGESIDVLGPLGNGFELPRITNRERHTTILIAGGIGVAPLIFLAEKLVEIQNPNSESQIIVLIGAKTKKLLLCENDFKKLGAEVYTATDDGTYGCKGPISKLFERFLPTPNSRLRTNVYACGPHPMLQCIAEICKKQKIDCQATLEENMACGIGACLGCTVKVKAKKGFVYKLACKDGPIFNTNQLIWS